MMNDLKTILIAAAIFIAGAAYSQKAAPQNESQKTAGGVLVDPTTNCVLRYYYFPNLEAYYDTQKNIYYYTEEGKWQTADEIPSGYRGYSMYNKVNIIIKDYDDDDPTQFLPVHRKNILILLKAG